MMGHIVVDYEASPCASDETKISVPSPIGSSRASCVNSQYVGNVNACASPIAASNRAMMTLIQKLLAEGIGTFILVFAGCGSVVVDTKSGGQVTHVGISITFGLVVTILIYTIGHISGCHLNPAVTIALASLRRFKWRLVLPYILAQVAGAISGSSAIYVVLGSDVHLGATLPAGSDLQSLALEMIITFILMFVIMGATTDAQSISKLGGIAIGATVALNALFAGPICGASMNPARSLGPAIVANTYESLWIYIVGPIIGAILGACAYEFIRITPHSSEE